jgi:hypothetical protein
MEVIEEESGRRISDDMQCAERRSSEERRDAKQMQQNVRAFRRILSQDQTRRI